MRLSATCLHLAVSHHSGWPQRAKAGLEQRQGKFLKQVHILNSQHKARTFSICSLSVFLYTSVSTSMGVAACLPPSMLTALGIRTESAPECAPCCRLLCSAAPGVWGSGPGSRDSIIKFSGLLRDMAAPLQGHVHSSRFVGMITCKLTYPERETFAGSKSFG